MSISSKSITSPGQENQDFGLLSYLRDREIGKTSQATKLWRKVERNETLINHLLLERAEISNTSTRNHITIARSKKEILNRIQKFANRIPEDQAGSFTCLFLSNPQYFFCTEVQYGFTCPKEVLAKETCFFIKTLASYPDRTDRVQLPCGPLDGISLLRYSYTLPNKGEFKTSALPEFSQSVVEIFIARGRELEEESIQGSLEETSSIQI
jgi:hypothetical protein